MSEEWVEDYDLAADYDEFGDSIVPQLIPPGKYILKVQTVKYRRSSKAAEPQLVITFVVVDGPYAGQEITHFLTWQQTPMSRRMNGTALSMMGATSEWIKTNRATFAATGEYIVGAVVEAAVHESTYAPGTNAIKSFVRNISLDNADTQVAGAVDLGAQTSTPAQTAVLGTPAPPAPPTPLTQSVPATPPAANPTTTAEAPAGMGTGSWPTL